MKSLVDQLSQYAAYHRDRRNILTHFVGIPMIVVAVTILLARPLVLIAGFGVSPASLAVLVAAGYYLALDLRYGIAMTVLLTLSLWIAMQFAVQPMAIWLGSGIGLFVLGWALQFVGHYYEGRKPAFVDDLMGLAIGPLFVVAEAGFLLGLRNEVRLAIEERAGPVRSGPAHA
jgi:uncharacterized membrane protein YGL010W